MTALFPELQRFPDAAERNMALGWALFLAIRAPWYLASAGGLILFAVLSLLPAFIWDLPAATRDLIGIWCVIVVPIGLVILLPIAGRSAIHQSLRRSLNAASVPTCIACGYDLTSHASNRCPECGEQPLDK